MHHRAAFCVAVVASSVAAMPARALCTIPVDPSVFCGAGATAIVAHLVDSEDPAPVDGAVVVVDAVGGEPMAGVAVGTELRLVPADDAVTVGLGRAADTQTLFVLRNVGTWVRAAPIVDDRVWLDLEPRHTMGSDEVLDLVALDDEQACVDRSNEVVEPGIYSGPCDDEIGGFGCAATPAGVPGLAIASLLLLSRRRRR